MSGEAFGLPPRAPYPVDLYAGCPCYACDQQPRIEQARVEGNLIGAFPNRMNLCPDCGNKRCPRASDHRNECSGSNEPGQAGSMYAGSPS